jgi:hypothetical protein
VAFSAVIAIYWLMVAKPLAVAGSACLTRYNAVRYSRA